MDELVVITPSRGRPQQMAEMVAACKATASGNVRVLPCLDDDDPALDQYRALLPSGPRLVGPRRTLSGWTNHAAAVLLDQMHRPCYLASLGDDHRPRTPGWDMKLRAAIEALGGPGIAYGNDLLQGERLCTAWVVSSELVAAVGWMMLPACEHMYVDRAVLDLGRASGRIVYRPDVVIEHLHPVAGKAGWDDSYRATNAPARYAADQAAYEAWRVDGLDRDVAKLTGVAARAGGG